MIAKRDLLQIIDNMMRRWIGQAVLALGDADGPGGVQFGEKRGRPFSEGHFAPAKEDDNGKHYFNGWQSRTRRIGSGETELAKRQTGGQVTLKEGQRAVRLAKERLKLGLLTGKVGKSEFKRAKTSYRSWQAREIAHKIADDVGQWAEEALLLANIHPRKSEKRFKRLSTTRDRKTLPYWFKGTFEFGGKGGAFRFPVGRPPLPEHEWIKRYIARREIDDSELESAPPTKHGRPPIPL